MTCTITVNAVREIIEEAKKTPAVLRVVVRDRWLTEGRPIENDAELEKHNSLLVEQKFRDYAWYQTGSLRKNLQSTTLKQYRPSENDISRHNPHV